MNHDPVGELKKITLEQELLFELTIAVFERIPDAVMVDDMDGVIRLVNAKAEELFGYHRSELIGMKVEKLLPERFRDRYLEHRKEFWRAPKERWMRGGKALLVLTKDGDEVSVKIMMSPIIMAQGRFVITVLRKEE